jgi:LPPG:FO 2-phospho-L-lactate transferase
MRGGGLVTARRVVAIAGGVGGAKLAHGLQLALDDATNLSVIVNTADDFDLYGLRICPDIDTVMYTLAGLANPATGWGIRNDTFATLEMIGRYSGTPWFQLGDRDFATHIVRTERLRAGQTLTTVTSDMAVALGIPARILPMCDAPVATMIETPKGRLDFQQYFVARRHADDVLDVHFSGIEQAEPSEQVLAVIAEADVIIFCPSNPIVSIGPVLAVPGLRAALEAASAPKLAVSPIVGGQALKGPAAQMLATLGHEVSAAGVATLYAGLVELLVIDKEDAQLAARIEAAGMRVHVTQTVMRSDDDRAALAREMLAWCS